MSIITKNTKDSAWKRIKKNLQKYILTGVLALMPFGVTLLVMQWLFSWMAGLLRPWLLKLAATITKDPDLQTNPDAHFRLAASILSIIVLLLLVYLFGLITRYVLGKKLIAIGELILLRIPGISTVYSATKQVVSSLSLPDKAAFRSVVLVEFPRPGFKAIGFLTGHIIDSNGQKYCKVFIPTTPNPTTGFFELAPENEVMESGMSVEDAFKMIISGGILSPDKLEIVKK